MKKILLWLGFLGILVSMLALQSSTLPGPVTAQQAVNAETTIALPLVFSNFSGTPEREWTILLKSRTFEPEPGLEAVLAARLRSDGSGRTHVLIQFDRVPTAAERAALAERGATLLGYIPNLAWLASIPSDDARALSILDLAPTRWLGSLWPEDKIDPFLLANGAGEWAQNPDGTVKIKVTLFEDVAREERLRLIAQLGGRIESEFLTRPSFWISIDPARIRALMQQDEVQFIGFYPPPPTPINNESTAWTRADDVQALGITGAGVVVSLWDEAEADGGHDDLAGRVVLGDATGTTSEHSTHVACTMAGDGTASLADPTLPDLTGYAPGAPTIVSYDYNGNVPNEYVQALANHNIQVANNSWGLTIGWRISGGAWGFLNNQNLFGAYTFDTPDYDGFVRDDGLTIVWAVGNDRNDANNCCTIPPAPNPGSNPAMPPDWDQGAGNNGYDTLMPPSTAKNVISVGAIDDDDDSMSWFSGWGPTDDGRTKPDLVAPGVDVESCDDDANDAGPGDIDDGYTAMPGTSMAAPAVSGAAALIIEQYNQTFGTDPLPSTIKALLVNEAVDLVDNPHTVVNDNLVGPDFIYGWGRMDVLPAIDRVRDKQVTEGSLDDGDPSDVYYLRILAGTPRLRVTIAWDDEPGQENSDPTLVNDLDLLVVDPNGTSHFPWLLDPNNPNTPATTGVDRQRNNVEQVEVENPIAGVWEVRVSPYDVPEGPQAYSLVPYQEPLDLSITKTDDPDPVAAGESLVYTIEVTNAGPAAASEVTVTDILPPEATYIPSGAGCTEAPAGTLTCALGALGVGASKQLEVQVEVDAATVYHAGGPKTITNQVEVISPEPDPYPGNDTASEDTLVIAAADLAIVHFEAVDAPPAVLAGQPVEVTLRKVIANYGPSAPIDAELTRTATAPAGSTVVPTFSSGVETELGLDELRTVREHFTLTCGKPGTQVFDFTNEIQPVHPEDGDPDPSNNSATVHVAIECVVPAIINIKPGSDPNSINLRNQGVIPIAVLTTLPGEYGTPLGLDATAIEPLSVRFGRYHQVWAGTGGAFEAHGQGHIEDSLELDERTSDGDLDMVLHFSTQETGLTPGDRRACAKGTWRDASGHAYTFFGCDAIRIVGE